MGSITLKQAAEFCGGRVASCFEHISFQGANFDTRRIKTGELFVALSGARDGHDFVATAMEKGAAAVLASKPLAENIPAIYVEDTTAALQQLAAGWRKSLPLKCVGITGSVGKTTTKEMIAAVLETAYVTHKTPENFNNGIGLPVTVLDMDEHCEMAVLEMGMNHFGEISLLTSIARPDIAVITNIGTMHIENLGSREGILKAKLEILEGLKTGGLPIFCGDDELLASVAEQYGALTYGLNEKNHIRATNVVEQDGETVFDVTTEKQSFSLRIPVQGRHNVLNALAATAVGLNCGLQPEQISQGLLNFRNAGMRQRIYEKNGIHILEDCYNAGPESMEAALSVLKSSSGRKIAALGGMLELGDFAPQAHYKVGQKAAEICQMLLVYGANSEEYVRGAVDSGLENARLFTDHESLAEALSKELRSGDNLLVKGSRGMKMEQVLRLLFHEGGTEK